MAKPAAPRAPKAGKNLLIGYEFVQMYVLKCLYSRGLSKPAHDWEERIEFKRAFGALTDELTPSFRIGRGASRAADAGIARPEFDGNWGMTQRQAIKVMKQLTAGSVLEFGGDRFAFGPGDLDDGSCCRDPEEGWIKGYEFSMILRDLRTKLVRPFTCAPVVQRLLGEGIRLPAKIARELSALPIKYKLVWHLKPVYGPLSP